MPGIAESVTGRNPVDKRQRPLPVAKSVSRGDMLEGKINGRRQAFTIAALAKEIGKDGRPGKDAAPVKDGMPGKDGKPGKDGLDAKPALDGVDGAPGKPGLDGAPGKDSKDGVDGAPGLDGAPGTPGRDGSPGVPGLDGSPGATGIGASGKPGKPGLAGPPGRSGLDGKRGEKGMPGDAAPTFRRKGVGYITGAISQKLAGIIAPTLIDWDTSAETDTSSFLRKNKRIHVIASGVYSIDGHFGANAPEGYRGRVGLALNGSNITDQGYGSYPLIRQDERIMTVFRWVISLNENDSVAVILTEDEGSKSELSALPGLCHIRVTRL